MNDHAGRPVTTPHRWLDLVRLAGLLLVLYLLVAYLFLPWFWRAETKRHPALADAPRVTRTSNGIPGDPVNLGLIGSEDDLLAALHAAGWFPADPITLKSSWKIAAGTILHRPYEDAPVSNLLLFGRKQDLAFEQPVGHDPRRRHHVRFWKADSVDENGRPLWFGAATFDLKVGFSHKTGQVTHHIAPDVDRERDKVIDDLKRAGRLVSLDWLDGFHTRLVGKNGGGDIYRTDGRLAVGTLTVHR